MMVIFVPVVVFSQSDNKENENKQDKIALFNSSRTDIVVLATIDFNIKPMQTVKDLDIIIDLFDKLDDKIAKLEANIETRSLKVSYSEKIELIDILQVLYNKGYPATFIAPNGQKACLNSQGEIEYWNVKN